MKRFTGRRTLTILEGEQIVEFLYKRGYSLENLTKKLSEFRGKGLTSLSIENNGKKTESYVEKWQKNRNAKIVFEFLTNSVYFQPIFLI